MCISVKYWEWFTPNLSNTIICHHKVIANSELKCCLWIALPKQILFIIIIYNCINGSCHFNIPIFTPSPCSSIQHPCVSPLHGWPLPIWGNVSEPSPGRELPTHAGHDGPRRASRWWGPSPSQRIHVPFSWRERRRWWDIASRGSWGFSATQLAQEYVRSPAEGEVMNNFLW